MTKTKFLNLANRRPCGRLIRSPVRRIVPSRRSPGDRALLAPSMILGMSSGTTAP